MNDLANYNLEDIGLPIFTLDEDLFRNNIDKDGVYQIDCDGFQIDILIEGLDRASDNYFMVCFTAAVSNRESKIGPFFSGRSLSAKLNMPLISIADPLVSRCDLNIAWYTGGENEIGLQEKISIVLKQLRIMFKVNFLFLGGSGAGFASLINLMIDKESSYKAIVWNPQTSIVEYFYRFVNQYIIAGFSEATKNRESLIKSDFLSILNNNNITSVLDDTQISDKHQYLYLQNFTDSHFKNHMQPYVSMTPKEWKRIGESSFINDKGNAGLYVGNWDGGHASPPEPMLIYLVKKILAQPNTVSILQDLERDYITLKNNTLPIEIYNGKNLWDFSYYLENNKLKVRTYFIDRNLDCEYAFYIIKNNKRIKHVYYNSNNFHVFDLSDLSELHGIGIRAYIRLTSGQILSKEEEFLDNS